MAKLKDGFYKLTASSIGSDLLVLLAGGGAKPISDFALAFNVKLWGNTFNGSSDVNGAIQFATAENTGSIKFLNGEFIDGYGNFHLSANSSSWNVFDNAQKYIFTILKSGNVGIGTTSPSYKLDVDGTIRATKSIESIALNDGYWSGGIRIDGTETIRPSVGFHISNLYGRRLFMEETNGDLMWEWSSTSGKPTYYILHSGNYLTFVSKMYWANVLISSTSNAATKPTFSNTIVNGVLAVNGGTKTLTINHNHTLSTAWNDFITCLNPNLTATYHTAHITFGRTYDSKNVGYIGFKYAGSASNSNMVTIGLHSVDNVLNILASGNVGIGTLTPTERLLVNGNIKIQGTSNTSTTPDIYLGYYTSWNGTSYPTLMSGHAGKWVMHLNPHIARHTGTDTPGANLRMESINKHYFDVSVGHDGLDTFKVRYDNSKNVLTISNTGQVNLINSIVFTGSVGASAGTYLAGTGTDGLFLAANEPGKKVFLESTNQDSPWFRNKNGDYAILHTGNASVFHRSDFTFTDGTTVADWTKATSATRLAGNWFSVNGWAWANSSNINVGGNLLDRMRYSALSIRNGNLTSTWAQQAILFIPTYADSGVIYLAQMTTAATAGSVSTTIKYYGDVEYNDRRYVNVTGDTMTGNLTAPAFYASSDINLKINIQEILNSDKMPIIKEFDWKADGSHSYGLIALELEEMGYPELVSNNGSYKTVNYSAALSLIVGKLQVKIKELEKEIEILKNKN